MKRRSFIQLGAASLAVPGSGTFAQKATTIVIGFPAGGATDVVGRLLAEAMRTQFEGPVVVDNRAGAGGRVAADYVKRAEADGSVLLVTPSPLISMYPSTYLNRTYDPVKDFKPVANLVSFPFLVAVGPMVPDSVKTFAQLVTWLKANPSKAMYAHTGNGAGPHFYGMLISKAIGVDMVPVAYRGDSPAVQDAIGGQVAVTINTPAAQLPMLSGGRLRVLATTAPQRIANFPNVPTLVELGYDVKSSDWIGAFLPSGASNATVSRWQNVLREALGKPQVQSGLQKLELTPAFVGSADFAAQIGKEIVYWQNAVKTTGFTPEN